jgi:hypothetical protein
MDWEGSLMNRSGKWFFALVLVSASGGCVSSPRLFHPGSAAYQQQKAVRFDPYVDNDIGPAVVGARPRDYDKPPAEPVRAHWVK